LLIGWVALAVVGGFTLGAMIRTAERRGPRRQHVGDEPRDDHRDAG
jgi:hypothetical protein